MSKSSFVHGKGHNWAQGTVADQPVVDADHGLFTAANNANLQSTACNSQVLPESPRNSTK